MYEDGMFKTIRSHDNIGHINFKNPSLYDLSKEEKSKAKSGSIFVSSKDDRFFIKSNNKADFNALKSCLPALATHLISGKENLTLPLYGCFESPNKKETFLLMKKLKANGTGPYTEVDFKGSIGKRLRGDWSRLDAYKDNNFECMFESIRFDDPQAAERVFAAMKNSIEFFKSQGLMDYSLCFKIELGCDNKPVQAGLRHKLRATCKVRGVGELQRITFHFLGILDYLTKHGAMKKVESFFQRYWPGDRYGEPSCVEPKRYALRMLAGLEWFFGPFPSLKGSIAEYEGTRYKNYTKRHRQAAIRSGSDKGRIWLELMEKQGARRQSVAPQGQKLQIQYGTGNYAQPTNWPTVALFILFVVGFVVLVAIGICLLLKRSRKSSREREEV